MQITLTDLSGNTITNPSKHDVIEAVADVVQNPEREDGSSNSIQLKDEDGWMLTVYGCGLLILEHEDNFKGWPSHLSNLEQGEVEAIFLRFIDPNDNLSDLPWSIGYGPS